MRVPGVSCLLTFMLLMSQVESTCGQTSRASSQITIVGGYSSLLYEHGGVISPLAHANFEVVNAAAKNVSLKILQVEMIIDGQSTKVEKFTIDVRRTQANGKQIYAEVKRGERVTLARNTSLALIINFPSSHLAIYSRKEQKVRLLSVIGGQTIAAETKFLIRRLEPWRPRPTRSQSEPSRSAASVTMLAAVKTEVKEQ